MRSPKSQAESSADGSEPSQRSDVEGRLLRAVSDATDRHGYPQLTVQRILSAARVSRSSFYQHFSSVDDCFWCAYGQHAGELLADVARRAGGSEGTLAAVMDALAACATSNPRVARLLMRECLAAGPAGLAQRDTLITRLAGEMTGGTHGRTMVDLPAATFIGGVLRFLSMRLTDGSPLAGLRDQLRQWARAFGHGSSARTWSELLSPAPAADSSWSWSPPSREAARRGASRERILRATALTIREKSYRDTTVTDIVHAAGMSRRCFYNEFATKADAFIATYEHGFKQLLAACAPAFFDAKEWPDRVWHGGEAFTRFLFRDPLIGYVGFVECYSLSSEFAIRVHDTQLAFTLFLEDGYRQPNTGDIPRAFSDLTAATIFELGFQASRSASSLDLRKMQPLAVYIALAPFIGRDAAGQFVAGKLAEGNREASAA